MPDILFESVEVLLIASLKVRSKVIRQFESLIILEFESVMNNYSSYN